MVALRPMPPLLSASALQSSSRSAALAQAAVASNLTSSAGGNPFPHFTTTDLPTSSLGALAKLDVDHLEAYPDLTASQARRSRAALHGSARVNPDSGLTVLPDSIQWAVNQVIASSDKRTLHQDHVKISVIKDPYQAWFQTDRLPASRSALLHLATTSPSRYAAILAVLSQVSQRLFVPKTIQDTRGLNPWSPDTIIDFDCATAEGLWAATKVFQDRTDPFPEDSSSSQEPGTEEGIHEHEHEHDGNSFNDSTTSIKRYYGFDDRVHLLKMGKRLVGSITSPPTPTPAPAPSSPSTETPLADEQDESETIEIDGEIYFASEGTESFTPFVESSQDVQQQQPFFHDGAKSAISKVEKTFLSMFEPIRKTDDGSSTLALSAFALSQMSDDSRRANAVQTMWDTGAEVIVLIDHDTQRGFACIASARAQLIELGATDSKGCFVVAPCQHDKPCPILHPFVVADSTTSSSKSKSFQSCGFTTRLATPSFLRKTKHSKRGHEDIGYSYVVVRRGQRPSLEIEAQRLAGDEKDEDDVFDHLDQLNHLANHTKSGILDLLRSAKLESQQRKYLEEIDSNSVLETADQVETQKQEPEAIEPRMQQEETRNQQEDETQVQDEFMALLPDALRAEMIKSGLTENDIDIDDLVKSLMFVNHRPSHPSSSKQITQPTIDPSSSTTSYSWKETETAMRISSYSWPRLVLPPLKKGGHVTFDACCSSGNIERFTISKSSGRQAYQDARKSKQGDLFPHDSKNKSIIRISNPITTGDGNGNDVVLELKDPKKIMDSSFSNNITITQSNGGNESRQQILNELFLSDQELERQYNLEDDDDDDQQQQGDKEETESNPQQQQQQQSYYKLIGADVITPTPKQIRKSKYLYQNKWNPTDSNGKRTSRASRKRSRGDYNLEVFGSY